MSSYSKVSKKVAVRAKMHCQHCKNLGSPFDTHNKDTCPKLQQLKCNYCGAKGHSQKYCEARKFDEEKAGRLHHFREKEKRREAFEKQSELKNTTITFAKTSTSAFAVLEGSSSESESETEEPEPEPVRPEPTPAWEMHILPRSQMVDALPEESGTCHSDYSDEGEDLPSMFDFLRPSQPQKPELGRPQQDGKKKVTPLKFNWADNESSEDEA